MAKIKWDEQGKRFYETGVAKGVLYVYDKDSEGVEGYQNGVAWNGLTAVTESPEGAEANALYADNTKYLNLISREDFKCTIEAYTYPDEFGACNGEVAVADGVSFSQQSRKTFGFSYQTRIGNDTDGDAKGYKIHLIYGCIAAPSEKSYATVNDSPEAITFSWEISTTPVEVTVDGVEYKPVAHIEIDSTKVDADKLAAFEKTLYGDTSAEPTLPMPAAVATAFASA